MTAPRPTREWLAGFLGRFHAKALTNPSAWVDAVDELEARLRPAFEHEHWKRVQNEQAYDREVELHEETRKQLDALRASLAGKDEALRVCGEALTRNASAYHYERHQLGVAPSSYRLEDCTAPICVEARAALARPDVKEIQ